jgi:hypothetical protein
MFNQVSYNVVVDRFKAFADGHYLIQRFTTGQIEESTLDKTARYPFMHLIPVSMTMSNGMRQYTLDVLFADLPREKEDKSDYQKESISDCIRLAEDLVSEIRNGQVVFGTDIELIGDVTITPFIMEYDQVLTGVTLTLTIAFPMDYSACDIPADYSIGGSGSGSPSGSFGLVLKTNGVNNALQNLLDLVDGTDIEITDLGNGSVRIDYVGSGGGGSGVWGAITGTLSNQTDLQNALNLKADISSLSLVAFSNDYNDLSNLPTIPSQLDDLTDVTITSPSGYDVLRYDNFTQQWINDSITSLAGKVKLDDLDDVEITTPTNGQVLMYDSVQQSWENQTLTGGVTSVNLTMPSAFNVTGVPITSSGTIAISGAGTTEQYVRGDGTLANFPSTGGGGGQIFYFNGNTSQGTIGGNTYYQLGTSANTGSAANFTRNTTGVIARFITDVGSPNHLVIPSGVWTIDVYLSETGGGSNNAEILAKLYVYDGSTFTLVGTSPVEELTNGNVVDLYTFGISIPNTITLASDRIHIEFDIQNTNGKIVTLYTENAKIGEVHTTYAIGLSSLNGLTANTQNFATGTSGTDFAINSVGTTHTFNIPSASSTNRGLLTSSDWNTFNTANNSNKLFLFGDSSFATGTTTINTPVILTEDRHYFNLTMASGGSLDLNGWRLFVQNNLDLTNAGASSIHNNGSAGANGLGTSGGFNGGANNNVGRSGKGRSVYGGFPNSNSSIANVHLGGNGGGGGSANTNGVAGLQSTAPSNYQLRIGGAGGSGGKGGNSAVATGGAGGSGQIQAPTIVLTAAECVIRIPQVYSFWQVQNFDGTTLNTNTIYGGRNGGGGGGGAGSSTNGARQGGCAGGGGGNTFVFAFNIIVAVTTNASAISSNGGNGGNGALADNLNCGGGGGAGAGGGGYVVVMCNSISTNGIQFISANGGTGGTGGNGNGTGVGGQGGIGGVGGRITIIRLKDGTITQVDGTSGTPSTPAIPTTITGSAGSSGTTATYTS